LRGLYVKIENVIGCSIIYLYSVNLLNKKYENLRTNFVQMTKHLSPTTRNICKEILYYVLFSFCCLSVSCIIIGATFYKDGCLPNYGTSPKTNNRWCGNKYHLVTDFTLRGYYENYRKYTYHQNATIYVFIKNDTKCDTLHNNPNLWINNNNECYDQLALNNQERNIIMFVSFLLVGCSIFTITVTICCCLNCTRDNTKKYIDTTLGQP
jgi:hypothetical protein